MYNRRSAPKVRDGKVQRKNRHAPTRLNSLSVGLSRAESGYRHVTSKEDVWKFLRLIPHWKRVSSDLDLIYLTSWGDTDYDGYYAWPQWPKIVLAPWPADLVMRPGVDYFQRHDSIFQRLGASIAKNEERFDCRFTAESARAYQLLQIFLHELGHHHFRITAGRDKSCGIEKYAGDYAFRMERRVWSRYCEAFRFDPQRELKNIVD